MTYDVPPGDYGLMQQTSSTQRLHAAMQRVRAADARHPRVWDVLLSALVGLPGFVQLANGGWQGESGGRRSTDAWDLAAMPDALPWLLWAGLVLPLLWRRRYPFAVLCAIVAVLTMDSVYDLDNASMVSVGVALFHVALRLPFSRLAWVAGIICVSIAIEMLREPVPDFAGAYIPVLAMVTAVVMTGLAMRTRREYVTSLLERAQRLEIERDQKAQLAAAAERARIAREMHDIVAHNLSVIVGLADGGSYAAKSSPERPAQALDAISATGRQALGELRRLLGVLAEESGGAAELTPQPGLADLEPLLDRVRAAGLPVRCSVSGDARELSEGRQLTVYRIVQEALTNTLKHGAAGATAEVVLSCTEGAVDLVITDTGRGAPGSEPGGQGLHGMRERAAVYDGELEAGPVPGGWRVHASLPAPATSSPAGLAV